MNPTVINGENHADLALAVANIPHFMLAEKPKPLPKIWVSGSDFVISLKTFPVNEETIPSLSVCCHDYKKHVASCRMQVFDDQPCLTFPILALRIPFMEKVLLAVNGQVIDLTEAFIHYRLDRDKLGDSVYLTKSVFNAGTRTLAGDGLFVVSYVYLDFVPSDNPNFGGFITMLSYRITDQLNDRAHLLHKIYMVYLQYRETVVCHDAIAFRWFVSSSNALTTALLASGNLQQAATVAEDALKRIVHPGLNPMVHQNYALLLFQAGLIKVWQNQFQEAASLFITAVNASRHGMIDILHPQNNWVLGQMSDCHKLLHVAEAAHHSAIACTRNKIPPPSRFAQMSVPPKLKVNFHLLFDRFACFKGGQLPPFFKQVLLAMQTYQEG